MAKKKETIDWKKFKDSVGDEFYKTEVDAGSVNVDDEYVWKGRGGRRFIHKVLYLGKSFKRDTGEMDVKETQYAYMQLVKFVVEQESVA